MGRSHIRLITKDMHELDHLIEQMEKDGINMRQVSIESIVGKNLVQSQSSGKRVLKAVLYDSILTLILGSITFMLLYYLAPNNYSPEIFYIIPFMALAVVLIYAILGDQIRSVAEQGQKVAERNSLKDSEVVVELDFDRYQEDRIRAILERSDYKKAS